MTQFPKAGDIWVYTKTGNKYWIQFTGESKIKDGEWIHSVTYKSIDNDKFYTRDLDTFLKKFKMFTSSESVPTKEEADPFLKDAHAIWKELEVKSQFSASLLQLKLHIGYQRAEELKFKVLELILITNKRKDVSV